MKIAYTFVISDLFHYGILQLLEKAREISDKVICGVLTDEAVEAVNKSKPISKFSERKSVIEAIKYVDEVMAQTSQDPTENLKIVRNKYPDAELVFVYGDQWKKVPGESYLLSANVATVQQKFYDELSNARIAYRTIQSIIPDRGVLDTFTSQFITDDVVTFKKEKPPFVVTSKAQTLRTLSPLLKKSRIEKMYIFTVKDWHKFRDEILENIRERFRDTHTVVRSSSITEDSLTNSKAGFYNSELNIDPQDSAALARAVDNVVSRYEDTSDLDQVLVQKQTEDILLSGVLFTVELETNAPYYVINYDESEKTDVITSGRSGKLVRIFRNTRREFLDSPWSKLLDAVDEIEKIIPELPLDIEFAVTRHGDVVIFQVRPLVANIGVDSGEIELIQNKIALTEVQYRDLCKDAGYLDGNELVFSDMSFWNPAELIGHKPSNLAYSLFNELIMKRVWNVGLLPLGHPNLFPHGLMERFLYKPYVNVNIAFRVLVPDAIPKELGEKLQKYYLAKLKADHSLHDKVEFEIVFSCYDFSLQNRLAELPVVGFSKKEINLLREGLISFTGGIIRDYKKHYDDSRCLIDELDAYNQTPLARRKESLARERNAYIIKEMADKCQQLGTIPFTTAARLAFIARALLQSLRSAGVIDGDELDSIANSFSTVATDFTRDINEFVCGRMSADSFMGRYGHLRSGTYDIEKCRYDAFIELSFPSRSIDFRETVIPEGVKRKIASFLKSSPLEVDFDTLYDFMALFTAAREHYKFVFTRTLSDMLELIKTMGDIIGISASELSFLEVKDIFNLFNVNPRVIRENIAAKKAEREQWDRIILPPLIFEPADFWIVQAPPSHPNFVTNKSIEGEVVVLEGDVKGDAPIESKIVFIENADPGFHWIFSRDIRGLVTKYGGAGSHMAICCAEFNIPAAIGCGELYDRLKTHRAISLDCANRVIT